MILYADNRKDPISFLKEIPGWISRQQTVLLSRIHKKLCQWYMENKWKNQSKSHHIIRVIRVAKNLRQFQKKYCDTIYGFKLDHVGLQESYRYCDNS